MLYWPTLQDMLGTLPPDELAELLALVGRAGAEQAGAEQAAPAAHLHDAPVRQSPYTWYYG